MKSRNELIALLRELQDNCGCCEDTGPCANCTRIDAALAPEAGETVRVRAAVAINHATQYAIAGGMDGDEPMLTEEMMEEMAERFAVIHFIEASIPLPVSKTVEGEVV